MSSGRWGGQKIKMQIKKEIIIHTCQCCEGIKSDGVETIQIKSELGEFKKEIDTDSNG